MEAQLQSRHLGGEGRRTQNSTHNETPQNKTKSTTPRNRSCDCTENQVLRRISLPYARLGSGDFRARQEGLEPTVVAGLLQQWEQELAAWGLGVTPQVHLQAQSSPPSPGNVTGHGWLGSQAFIPSAAGRGPALLRPRLEVLATRVGGHQPGRALFPRNGLQWSVNGQILACHVTEGEKMSACFLYLMHKNYLNLRFFFFFEAACVVGGKRPGWGQCTHWMGASALGIPAFMWLLDFLPNGLSFLYSPFRILHVVISWSPSSRSSTVHLCQGLL